MTMAHMKAVEKKSGIKGVVFRYALGSRLLGRRLCRGCMGSLWSGYQAAYKES